MKEHKMKEHNQHKRSSKGQSIVELLIATLIFAAVSVVLLSLYSINTMQLSGFYNKGDALTSSTDALNRIGLLTRGARGFGENYGIIAPNPSPQIDFTKIQSTDLATRMAGINTSVGTANLLNGTGFVISSTFPAAGDPYYGTGNLPGAFYGGNWPMTTNSGVVAQITPPGPPAAPGQYTLGQDTLILQVPVFVNSGGNGVAGGGNGKDPSQDPGQAQGPFIWPATYNGLQPQAIGTLQAVDTYVFRVLPDPNAPGTYVMEEAAFPACPAGVADINPLANPAAYTGHPTNVTLPTNAPAILVKGIVGPLDANGNISTFNYIEKVNNSSTTVPPVAPLYTSDYNGVLVQMEVLKMQQGVRGSITSFKSEFFVRNNSEVQME